MALLLRRRKVLILDSPGSSYAKPFVDDLDFEPLYLNYKDRESYAAVISGRYRLPWIECVLFTGGSSDVHPMMYNAQLHPLCRPDMRRDTFEEAVYLQALNKKVPMVGVCRGLQFLNVMNGGRLFQHVTHHHGKHSVSLVGGIKNVPVNSSHHQMCIPRLTAYTPLAWSSKRSTKYEEESETQSTHWMACQGHELESIWWMDEQCFGVQWHPEWLPDDAPARTLFTCLVDDLTREYSPREWNPSKSIKDWAGRLTTA